MKAFKLSGVVYFLIILVVMGGAYMLIRGNAKPENVVKEIPIEPAKPALIIDKSLSKDVTYTTPDKYTIFKVAYPQFKNTSSEFNHKIATQVNDGIASQKKDGEENWKARYNTRSEGDKITEFPATADKFYFNASWKPTQENNDFISFILTISAYSGGAHGYEVLTSYNYDVADKKEVELADLFPDDPDYLKTISELTRKDLTSQFREKMNIKTKDEEKAFQGSIIPMMMDGTTPVIENFSVFTFTEDKITFYFNQYQVGPYSMGTSQVTMSRE